MATVIRQETRVYAVTVPHVQVALVAVAPVPHSTPGNVYILDHSPGVYAHSAPLTTVNTSLPIGEEQVVGDGNGVFAMYWPGVGK